MSSTAGLPLAKDLLRVVADSELDKTSHAELCEFLEFLMPTFTKEYLNYPDVEEFLTLLDVVESYSLSAAGKLEFPRRRLSKLRRTFLTRLAKYLWTGHKNLGKDHPIRLFASALRAGDTIVTFNYDLTMDAAIYDLPELAFRYRPTTEHIGLLKPHGSIDWFYADEVEADGDKFRGLFDDLTQSLEWNFDESIEGKMPVIVPPVATKLIDLRDLQRIWKWVTDALVKAEAIYILGYSLSPADRLTRFVLRRSIQMRKQPGNMWVVNPDGQLRGRFQEWISPEVKFVPQNFEQWVINFHKNEMESRPAKEEVS